MPHLITGPVAVPVPGGKTIHEYVGRLSTSDEGVSIAHMKAPPHWDEPAQTPQFREFTVVLAGQLSVEHEAGTLAVGAGQAVITEPGERIRYGTGEQPAEYVAICLPAFSLDTVNREDT